MKRAKAADSKRDKKKKEEEQKQLSATEIAQQALQSAVEAASTLPTLKQSDEDLGLGDLKFILPDSWNNIAWVIQSSIEVLRDQTLNMRRLVEQVKKHAIE